MLERIAPETFSMTRSSLLDEMDRRKIGQLLGHKCTEILKNGLKVINGKGEETFLEADTICYSVGMKSDSNTVVALKEAAGSIPVFEIGDCNSVGKVVNATESAYRATMEIV